MCVCVLAFTWLYAGSTGSARSLGVCLEDGLTSVPCLLRQDFPAHPHLAKVLDLGIPRFLDLEWVKGLTGATAQRPILVRTN